jgi:cytochrome c551/c552
MIEGMAHAARTFGREDWLASACRALDFLYSRMWKEARLLATYKDGRAHLNAYVDDYAFLLAATLEMLQAEFRKPDLEFAIGVADALLEHFEDRGSGGFFFTSHDHEQLILRPKPGHDNATPSGNGVAALALTRLGHLLGETRYLRAAEATVRLFYPAMVQHPAGFATLCTALAEVLEPTQTVVLRGPRQLLREWQQALSRTYLPDTLTLALDSAAQALPRPLDKPAGATVNAIYAAALIAWHRSGISTSAGISEACRSSKPVDRFKAGQKPINVRRLNPTCNERQEQMKTSLMVIAAAAAVLFAGSANAAVDAAKAKALAQSKTCLACHAVDKKLVGPSYLAIAKKYTGNKDAAAMLSKKVFGGGGGVWGTIPMPPNRSRKTKPNYWWSGSVAVDRWFTRTRRKSRQSPAFFFCRSRQLNELRAKLTMFRSVTDNRGGFQPT